MIAGGTGAGKSELLMTLIVGLALRYDPTILNFVLVDYKGGGAFKPFETLPHVVDIVTNLNKAAVRRVFTTISAEMQRRQKLNADTSTKDIIEYRRKGLHLTREPFPHLFIIIDEYAEMITDSPEFKDELDSITRVGRSIGVNLLLASQRPVGVSDQMRANIKYRMCLRVEGYGHQPRNAAPSRRRAAAQRHARTWLHPGRQRKHRTGAGGLDRRHLRVRRSRGRPRQAQVLRCGGGPRQRTAGGRTSAHAVAAVPANAPDAGRRTQSAVHRRAATSLIDREGSRQPDAQPIFERVAGGNRTLARRGLGAGRHARHRGTVGRSLHRTATAAAWSISPKATPSSLARQAGARRPSCAR